MCTKEQVKAVITLVTALADSIRELGSVPSGHLYAMVMNTISLNDFTHAIAVLKSAGVVTEQGHVLTWAGPKLEAKNLPES